MALDPSSIYALSDPQAFNKSYATQTDIATKQAALPGIQADSQIKQASVPLAINSAKIDQAIKENQLGIQLISSVTDQRSLEAAMQTAQKYGIDTSRFPKTYDPAAIQQIAMGALQAKDRLDMMYKNIDIGFKNQEMNLNKDKFQAEYPNAAGAAAQTRGGTLGAPNPPSLQPTPQPDDQGSITPPVKDTNSVLPDVLPIDGAQDAVPISPTQTQSQLISPQPTAQGQAQLMQQPGAKQYASNGSSMTDASGQAPAQTDDFQPLYNAKGEPMKGVGDGTQVYMNSKGEKQERLPKGDSIYDKQVSPNVHGDEYLKTIPDPIHQAYVKGVANGEIPLPTPRGKAEQQQLMDLTTAVKQYDPSFYSGRAAKLNDFRGGDEQKQIATFSKSIEHLDTLGKLAGELNNTSSPTFNAIANEVSKQTGSPKVSNFNAAKEIVAKELDKAIAGVGGTTIAGAEDAKAQLEAASSPEQLKGAISTIQDLMGGQLVGLEQSYKSSVGGEGFKSLLTPKAAEVFDRYGKAEPKAPVSQIKEGATATNSMGHKITFKGGKWQ